MKLITQVSHIGALTRQFSGRTGENHETITQVSHIGALTRQFSGRTEENHETYYSG
jgi:hypothetical protein